MSTYAEPALAIVHLLRSSHPRTEVDVSLLRFGFGFRSWPRDVERLREPLLSGRGERDTVPVVCQFAQQRQQRVGR
jgi:hypothetical protein